MTLEEITDQMHHYNNSVAYGSESEAWVDYVEDCYASTGFYPWEEPELTPIDEFVAYWIEVASGESSDYTDSGERVFPW
jgi:hypothetical protein